MLNRFLKDESGATIIEYGLIIAVLSLAILGAMSTAFNAIQNNFEFSAGIMERAIDQ